ncbi:phosphopyruvate hydratase [Candidatus Woesebacteria bacterium]|nr:phosphopyruvate hydratase [Candidatus Woesebacteria bacterium]
MRITNLFAHEILDSKGDPTLEVLLELENGIITSGQVPSGASTGATEAFELRDKQPRMRGKGVTQAAAKVNTVLKPALVGKDVTAQRELDSLMIQLDGTENKSNIGGNSLTGTSLAICRAGAAAQKLPLFKYIGKLSNTEHLSMPQPMILIMEGGKHGNWATDIQEFMIVPQGSRMRNFREMLFAGAEVFHALEKILLAKGYDAGVGFEGAYCPRQLSSNEEALTLIVEAITQAGYHPGEDFQLAVDVAASEFFHDGNYVLHSEQDRTLTSADWANQLSEWLTTFPFMSIEDPFHQESWSDWQAFTALHGQSMQIVGDDLVTTNVQRIKKAIDSKSMNSTLIKVNQIGTISETLDAIAMTKQAGFASVVSHRGGETNDDTIADLVVGTASEQCKFGGPDRGERLAKYNRLLRIENLLLNQAGAI